MKREKGEKREMANNRNKEDKKGMHHSKGNVGNIFTSPGIRMYYNREENEFYKAVIEFYGVDVSGPSYEGRVFLNNHKANGNTSLNEKSGYIGSYYIFGHNGCFGDEGHCEIPSRRTYDSRSKSDVTPCYKSLDATKVIKKLIESKDEIIVTIVPLVVTGGRMGDAKDVVHIDRIRISCYENYLKLTKSD
jgi:hypothetical protein